MPTFNISVDKDFTGIYLVADDKITHITDLTETQIAQLLDRVLGAEYVQTVLKEDFEGQADSEAKWDALQRFALKISIILNAMDFDSVVVPIEAFKLLMDITKPNE